MIRTLMLLCLLFSFSFASNFKEKVVLVTGGSEGIGYATSLELARKGAFVVFCARDSHPTWFNGSTAEQTINSDFYVHISGGSARFFKADVRKIDEVRNFIDFAHKLYGRIDHAVNNAGVSGYIANIVDLADENILDDHDPILTNLYGSLNCIKEEAKYWQKYGNPNQTYSMVSVASLAGLIGCPGCSLYSASKFGTIGLVKSAALEFINVKPKIRINAVCPGFVDTSLVRNQLKLEVYHQQAWEGDYIDEDNLYWPKFREALEETVAGKRIAQPQEIAKTIISVLDNENSYMNGAAISVDDAGLNH